MNLPVAWDPACLTQRFSIVSPCSELSSTCILSTSLLEMWSCWASLRQSEPTSLATSDRWRSVLVMFSEITEKDNEFFNLFIYLLFFLGSWLDYLTDLLSLRLVGAVGARINARASCLKEERGLSVRVTRPICGACGHYWLALKESRVIIWSNDFIWAENGWSHPRLDVRSNCV